MAEPLKNLIDAGVVEMMAAVLSHAAPDFDGAAFRAAILPRLDGCELMERALLITAALEQGLPQEFPAAAEILTRCLPTPDRQGLKGWSLLAVNHYVARRGLEHPDLALDLLKRLTPHFTAEFGIRAFIHADQQQALSIIAPWTGDPDHHVRRLASEGTRPRLPWAMRLPALVNDPAPILPILEALVDDPEDYVRRSVANSLNDIAKDHPDLVADFVARHMLGASKQRLWLLKHASRTLIKNGHAKALANFGFEQVDDVAVELTLSSTAIGFPGMLDFVVALENTGSAPRAVVMDYVIHHRKKAGSLSPKVFKGKALELAPGERMLLTRRHAFRPITTRVYHRGQHRLEILVNGTMLAGADFELLMPEMEES